MMKSLYYCLVKDLDFDEVIAKKEEDLFEGVINIENEKDTNEDKLTEMEDRYYKSARDYC